MHLENQILTDYAGGTSLETTAENHDEINSTGEGSNDVDPGSILEEDNADETSHVSEQVSDVVYVFHNVSFQSLFCSLSDTYVA